MMTLTQIKTKVMTKKDGEDDDDAIWATAQSHSLIGGGGAAVRSVTDSQTHTETASLILSLCHTVENHVTP